MTHLNYCGVCQGLTEHAYETSNNVRWEICKESDHGVTMSEVISKLEAIVQRKVN